MAQEIDHSLEARLYDDVCSIIEQARYRVAVYVNSEASLMNWNVGKRIKEDVLFNKRADYGEQVLKRLSQRVKSKYGTGWGYQKLQHYFSLKVLKITLFLNFFALEWFTNKIKLVIL